MAVKKEYRILILVIAVLSLYLLVQKSDNIRYDLPKLERFTSDEITKLTIGKKGSTITLIQEENRWYIEPQRFPADSGVVKKLLDDINGMRLTALASESKNYAPYELDDDNRISLTVYRGEEEIRSIVIGKLTPSYRHTFVRLNGDHRVYHAADDMRTALNKTVPELRDKTVMNIDEDISELTVTTGRKQLTVIKAETIRGDDKKGRPAEKNTAESGSLWRTAHGGPANDKEIDGLIHFVSSLSCDNYIEGKRKEEYRSPLYTVRLKGIKRYTISLFKKVGSTYPAVSSESSYPFLIAEWKAKKIMKDFGELVATQK